MHTWTPTTRAILLSLILPALASVSWAQEEPDAAAVEAMEHRKALEAWLADYKLGAIRLLSKGLVVQAEVDRARRLMERVARSNDLPAAQLLFGIATVSVKAPDQSSTSSVDFYTELRMSQVRAMAREQIVRMESQAVEDWLLEQARKSKGAGFNDVAQASGAALRILAARPGPKAKEALLAACRSFKPEVKVQAVNALSHAATVELLPHFFELIRDKEPYIRIAALNGIGRALRDHTDETVNKTIDPEIAKKRDEAIEIMGQRLIRDRVWQVRACARENLTQLKSKFVIPMLIAGLEAELKEKKDPWALDIRLHRVLEGLTGQKLPVGQVQVWKEFWKKEGAAFKFAPAGTKAAEAAPSKYEKFFDIELETNRVLFVVDFSGSMVEKIVLKTRRPGTQAESPQAGRETTKAKLVVDELKKMVLTLQDGDLFNIIVFNDDVRIWKARSDGRPELVKMNDARRDDLLGGYLDSLMPAGMTNLYGALDAALGFGGRGLHDKYYGLGFDTLYVLSDGAPTAGKITDTAEILRVVREANALKRLTIHTITFGELNQLEFLRDLAHQNGGRHVHVE